MSSPIIYDTFGLSVLPGEEQRTQLEKLSTQLQASLNITQGSVWGAALFDLGNYQQRLFLFAHHLVIDGVSWRILLEDLGHTYEQLSEELPIELPQKTTSYQEWSVALEHHANSEELGKQVNYWLSSVPSDEINSLPTDFEGNAGVIAEMSKSDVINISLSEETTEQLLHQAPQAYRTQINDILLA